MIDKVAAALCPLTPADYEQQQRDELMISRGRAEGWSAGYYVAMERMEAEARQNQFRLMDSFAGQDGAQQAVCSAMMQLNHEDECRDQARHRDHSQKVGSPPNEGQKDIAVGASANDAPAEGHVDEAAAPDGEGTMPAHFSPEEVVAPVEDQTQASAHVDLHHRIAFVSLLSSDLL